VTERNLCAECAKEEGFGELFERETKSLMSSFNSFFADPFEGFFDDFFGSRSLFPSFGRSLLSPMLTLPRIHITLAEPEKAKEEAASAQAKTETVTETDEEMSRKRELNALKNQLSEAVKNEEFEKCIELRDKIKELEK